ncbi:MAG: hypothetical protein V1787_04590 [Candidatus Micrarchaeota archaeon]
MAENIGGISVFESRAHKAKRTPGRTLLVHPPGRLVIGNAGEKHENLALLLKESMHRKARATKADVFARGWYLHEDNAVEMHGAVHHFEDRRLLAAVCSALKEHGVPDAEFAVFDATGRRVLGRVHVLARAAGR